MNQLEKIMAGYLQMVRLYNGLVDFLDEQLAADFLSQGRMILFQETTSPRKRLDHAEAFQFRISFGDRVAVDAKFLSQRTDGWERLAGPQRPRCSRGLDLIDRSEERRVGKESSAQW